jgi:hypothetical protein
MTSRSLVDLLVPKRVGRRVRGEAVFFIAGFLRVAQNWGQCSTIPTFESGAAVVFITPMSQAAHTHPSLGQRFIRMSVRPLNDCKILDLV